MKQLQPGLASRFAAWRILHDVRHGVPFDVALNRAVRDLEPDDRRLAHELAAGVFRSRSALDQALGPAVERGMNSVRPDTLDVLRLGAYQLLQLDKIPEHAAVQTTVGVARRLGGRRIAGFVNAVLRRLTTASTSETPPTAVSSHPAWLVERWTGRFGAEETARLLAWNDTRPSLVIQPARWSRADLEAALRAAEIEIRPAPYDAGLVVSARKPTELPGFREGAFQVQDPAQRLVVRFLAPGPADLVYDACASPGGKAIALGRNGRFVVAADRSRPKVKRLVENVARAGGPRIAVIRADVTRPPIRRADAVLLDVPCLGTGTLGRNPDARWRITAEGLGRLVAQGAEFLRAAADVVRPGGLLLFSTCSLEPEENEDQVGRFLAADPRYLREPSAGLPAELLTPEGDLFLVPHRHGTDGAYAARLRRRL